MNPFVGYAVVLAFATLLALALVFLAHLWVKRQEKKEKGSRVEFKPSPYKPRRDTIYISSRQAREIPQLPLTDEVSKPTAPMAQLIGVPVKSVYLEKNSDMLTLHVEVSTSDAIALSMQGWTTLYALDNTIVVTPNSLGARAVVAPYLLELSS